MPLKPCLECGTPTPTTRCSVCRPEADPTPRHRRSVTDKNGTVWKNLSARLRRAQPWCTVCGTTEDLTVDHIVPQSLRPDLAFDENNLQVLCRVHNSRKATRGDNPARPTSPGAALGLETKTLDLTSRVFRG